MLECKACGYKYEEEYQTVNRERIKDLCISGLMTDGGHHKQWHLEQILEVCGYDLKKIARELSDEEADFEEIDRDEYWDEYNYDGLFWERGIPP